MKPLASASFSIENLLLTTKALPPLAEEALQSLREVERLDVSKYSEADVRAEVIDPIVRALGYKKETYFSHIREKHLKLLDADLFVDFNMTLMSENFWVIEAKKVKRKALRFIAAELRQALLYAVHPEINAALVVLCNGRILHVFDREESLTTPILKIEIAHLVRDFDLLRAVLSPWQVWFFEKRRILRTIDKVFDLEPNMNRLQEFRALVDSRLAGKRSLVLKNYQELSATWSTDEHLKYLNAADPVELIDLHFFLNQPAPAMSLIARRLVDQCNQNSFPILHRMFPDHPRATNDTYWGHALNFLLHLEASGNSTKWLPSYLLEAGSSAAEPATAVRRLVGLCLSGFGQDAGRRCVLLYAAAARRIAKQMLFILPGTDAMARMHHASLRHHLDEFAFAQFVSTPAGQWTHLLDTLEQSSIHRMVAECVDEHGNFSSDKGAQRLKEAWRLERAMLKDGSQYRASRQATPFHDSPPSEAISLAYDYLGHFCLCVMNPFPKWKSYALTRHAADIDRLARYGSWQAKQWLGRDVDTEFPRPSIAELATQFFNGDVDLLQALATGYGIKI